MARSVCGEGIPDFYAQQILRETPNYCINDFVDPILHMTLSPLAGFCKSIHDYGFRFDDQGRPLIEDCVANPFGMYYMTTESMTILRAFYWNGLGMRDKYEDFWAASVKYFKHNPYVIGIDAINEPFPGW